jgi:AmmeMemoRadiSam system protein A
MSRSEGQAEGGGPAARPRERGRTLLRLARRIIAEEVGGTGLTTQEMQGETGPGRGDGAAGDAERSGDRSEGGERAAAVEPWLSADGACFVTLTRQGILRGCIGSVRARRPLLEDLRSNARAAALHDPRFPPVGREELPDLHIEVSLLSEPKPLEAASEEEALAALRPGVDGVILEYGEAHHSTFLPQVWEQLRDPRDFLAHLKHKAGLSPDFWSPALRLWRYEVETFEEDGPGEGRF